MIRHPVIAMKTLFSLTVLVLAVGGVVGGQEHRFGDWVYEVAVRAESGDTTARIFTSNTLVNHCCGEVRLIVICPAAIYGAPVLGLSASKGEFTRSRELIVRFTFDNDSLGIMHGPYRWIATERIAVWVATLESAGFVALARGAGKVRFAVSDPQDNLSGREDFQFSLDGFGPAYLFACEYQDTHRP